jgi:hypothetical protein
MGYELKREWVEAGLKAMPEYKEKQKEKERKKKLTPIERKYEELSTKYGTKFGHNTGTMECEELLDDLRAFERVMKIMKIR